MELISATTVARPKEEVYDLWRAFDRFSTFMTHLDSVTTTDATHSHWVATAPFGKTVEWDAEMTEDEPGSRIAWHSLEGSQITNEGEVWFVDAPGDRGTEVRARIRYDIPAGPLGAAVAKYFGEEPHQQLDDDMRRFKQVMETGEVVRSEGAPGGKQARKEFPQHAAQPLTKEELAEVNA